MPVDANLDYAYFMKNRDRLIKLINFLKEDLEVTDENVGLRSIQEKITRNGLGLRDIYSVSAMASLSPFIASMGGVNHFRTASLEMIASHRVMALYIIHYLKDVPEVPGKCPYFKCSLVSSEKLYRSIFGIRQDEKLLDVQSRAMQHILQSKNYYNDYFDLKKAPVDPTWNEEDVLNQVKNFIQQQISFDKNKKEKLSKKNNSGIQGKDDQEDQKQEKEIKMHFYKLKTPLIGHRQRRTMKKCQLKAKKMQERTKHEKYKKGKKMHRWANLKKLIKYLPLRKHQRYFKKEFKIQTVIK